MLFHHLLGEAYGCKVSCWCGEKRKLLWETAWKVQVHLERWASKIVLHMLPKEVEKDLMERSSRGKEQKREEDDVSCTAHLLDKLALFPIDGDSSVFCCPFIRSLRIAYISQFPRFYFQYALNTGNLRIFLVGISSWFNLGIKLGKRASTLCSFLDFYSAICVIIPFYIWNLI